MWRCTRCETDNADADVLCNGCDWHSPNLISIISTLLEDREIPTYWVKWEFSHSSKASINNGIGEVSSSGETTISIKDKFKLIFSVANEYSQKEFSKILLLPAPKIEAFSASTTTISLNEPISLFWVTKFADKTTLSEFGDVTGTNRKELLLRKTSSISLIVENPSGVQEKSISFFLPIPIINDFKSDKTKVIAGDEILLKWTTVNAEELKLIGLGKTENLIGDNKVIAIEKSTTITLIAKNSSGETNKSIIFDIIPKPEILFLKLNKPIILRNEEVTVTWAAVNFSNLFLLIDDEVLAVPNNGSFTFKANKTKEIKLVCESIEKIKTISSSVIIKVIEQVSIDYLSASTLYTIQSKPVNLNWKVSNATEITLLPIIKKLDAEGSLSVLPSKKTIYILKAKNELTLAIKEIEIDVLPLPNILNIRLVTPPIIQLPSFYESRIAYPPKNKSKVTFLSRIKEYFLKKFVIKEPKSLKTTYISFNQHSEYIEVNIDASLMRIVSSLKEKIDSK